MRYRSVFRPGLFDDKTVIVTGGGSGIGRCTAHELAQLGAKVALIGRKPEKLEAVKGEIEEDGGTAACFPLDIRSEEDVESVVGEVISRLGGIDGLVNNAGGQYPSPLAAITQKGWEAVVRTNLTGGFLMARECYTQHMAEHGGAIVNIVADMWMGMPGMAHSGAARAGMVNLTQTSALEWGFSGVRVNAVAPGWIASSGLDTYGPGMKDTFRRMKQMVPLGRLGTESETSAAIVFLLSEAAAFISGATLRVDGAAPNYKRIWDLPAHEPSVAYEGFHRSAPPQAVRDDGDD
jgi:citronellol/citronellal dehydrogenase